MPTCLGLEGGATIVKLCGFGDNLGCPRSVALGTFDGVHRGHQRLLSRAVDRIPVDGCSTVLTLDYPPDQYFQQQPRLICDFETRRALIQRQGISEVVWLKFDEEIASLRAEVFIRDILVDMLHASHVICGFNYRFGHKAEGTPELLRVMGRIHNYRVDVVPPMYIDGRVVSSTRIRQALDDGDVRLAHRLLGRPQSYRGIVAHGQQRGRKLGFPTANLSIQHELVLPRQGVYLTYSHLADGQSYPSLTAIGDNPTFGASVQTVETYLMDFDGNLYGQEMELSFLDRLRDIYRFSSVEELKHQMRMDQDMAQERLAEFRLHSGRLVLE